jgi:hypothetical protein
MYSEKMQFLHDMFQSSDCIRWDAHADAEGLSYKCHQGAVGDGMKST